ncbi:transposase [Citreimonas salinaria]|uniref:transposase n=1 Tax=Citreimonas salinaria TaxID=321339 RepID=UPI0015A4FB63|nr:transposase [Citreimonas salinaria]
MQIDFGERWVEIGGTKVKVFFFVATLGHFRRLHVRAFCGKRQDHWFEGMEGAFRRFGGVPPCRPQRSQERRRAVFGSGVYGQPWVPSEPLQKKKWR